jgi:hypothetical protein
LLAAAALSFDFSPGSGDLGTYNQILSSGPAKRPLYPAKNLRRISTQVGVVTGWESSRSATHERAEAARSTGRLSLQGNVAPPAKKAPVLVGSKNGKRTQA